MGAIGRPTIEVYPTTWRRFAGKAYCDWKQKCKEATPPISTDEQDAAMIGYAVLAITKSFNGASKKKR
jgi:predicted nuclease with RNAse H fold